MWRRLFGIVGALAFVALAACSGGGTSPSPLPVTPAGGSTGSGAQSTSRLQSAAAPSQQIQDLYTRKSITRGSVKDPLANWVFLEPLAATDQAVFSVPSWVTQCAAINPIFGGLWYLSLSNFTDTLGQTTLPSCTIPATTSADAANRHPDAIIPTGNGNIYIVEIDVGFISLTTSPIAGPALGSGSTWLFGSINGTLTFQRFHLYAFFLAEYTGTGSPTTQSI